VPGPGCNAIRHNRTGRPLSQVQPALPPPPSSQRRHGCPNRLCGVDWLIWRGADAAVRRWITLNATPWRSPVALTRRCQERSSHGRTLMPVFSLFRCARRIFGLQLGRNKEARTAFETGQIPPGGNTPAEACSFLPRRHLARLITEPVEKSEARFGWRILRRPRLFYGELVHAANHNVHLLLTVRLRRCLSGAPGRRDQGRDFKKAFAAEQVHLTNPADDQGRPCTCIFTQRFLGCFERNAFHSTAIPMWRRRLQPDVCCERCRHWWATRGGSGGTAINEARKYMSVSTGASPGQDPVRRVVAFVGPKSTVALAPSICFARRVASERTDLRLRRAGLANERRTGRADDKMPSWTGIAHASYRLGGGSIP